MTGLTDFITESRWEDIFLLWFVIMDDAYQVLESRYGRLRRRGPKPTFSDSEVITVALIIDTWFHGDEAKGLSFLRQYHLDLFPELPTNGTFNQRRRTLRMVSEQIRRYLLAAYHLIDPENRQRFMDSAPVHVCAYGRAARNDTITGPEYVGLVSSNKSKFFGFRLQTTVTYDQVIDEWMLAPAGRKDCKMMDSLLADNHDLVIFADNAYKDTAESDHLWDKRNILVWAVPRRDSRQPWPAPFKKLVRRLRLRIETAFSVLTTVFNVEKPGSRSLDGLIARTATRILAYTLSFVTALYLLEGDI